MKDITELKKEMENLNIELNLLGWFNYLDYLGVDSCGSCRYISRFFSLENMIEDCRYCLMMKHKFKKMEFEDWKKSLGENF